MPQLKTGDQLQGQLDSDEEFSGLPWTEDDLTSEEGARRATHSAERARELRRLAGELQESEED